MDFTKLYRGQVLRMGFTTGSCATAAAKAAAIKLLCGREENKVTIKTPQNIDLNLAIHSLKVDAGRVIASVIKDAGDDPDITDGMEIIATVSKIAEGVEFARGEGVGLVTKPGLDQGVGEPAINSGPRQMIKMALKEVCEEAGYEGGLRVEISVPGGEKVAAKTFNPRLGIEGGISIIGTTGIVEPMSNQALIDTIALEIRQLALKGAKDILLISGNYSAEFLKDELKLDQSQVVVCSNFVRDSIELAMKEGFQRILLIGHIGKFVKLGIGMPNTHSENGDGRIETLLKAALLAGAQRELLLQISGAVTTDALLYHLRDAGLLEATMQELSKAISYHLDRMVPDQIELGFLIFTKKEGLPSMLIRSQVAEEILASLEEEYLN